jgi:hypothetical protein
LKPAAAALVIVVLGVILLTAAVYALVEVVFWVKALSLQPPFA